MEKVKLGEIFKIKKGTKIEATEIKESSIRYIQIDDLRNDNNIKYCHKSKGYAYANINDIIIAWDGANAGTIGYGLNGAIGSTLAVLKSEMKDIHTNYIGMYLQSKFKYLRENCTGATIPHISRNVLENIPIPLPPLETQIQIANTLDKVKGVIYARKKQIEKIDEYIKSVFYTMFGDPVTNPMGWEVIKLCDLTEVKTGGTPSRDNADYWNGNIPWVKTGEIKRNTIVKVEEYITESGLKNSNASLIPTSAILIAMYGQGKTRGMVAKLGIDATINQACAAILPSKKYIPDYALYLLILSYDTLRLLGRGGNQPNLNLGMIKDFEIMLPPITLQNQFASIVEKSETQKELFKKSLSQMETLFDCLMDKYFN